mmetsp:Transcript_59708/g.194894  ORF Transcript_59708/g.194894 Transcript_59708/m.194894 type:complete len:253 (-) Transcript_59708:9-767(-)
MLQQLLIVGLPLLEVDVAPLLPHHGLPFLGSPRQCSDALDLWVILRVAPLKQVLRLCLHVVRIRKGVCEAQCSATCPTVCRKSFIIFGDLGQGPIFWHDSVARLRTIRLRVPLAFELERRLVVGPRLLVLHAAQQVQHLCGDLVLIGRARAGSSGADASRRRAVCSAAVRLRRPGTTEASRLRAQSLWCCRRAQQGSLLPSMPATAAVRLAVEVAMAAPAALGGAAALGASACCRRRHAEHQPKRLTPPPGP